MNTLKSQINHISLTNLILRASRVGVDQSIVSFHLQGLLQALDYGETEIVEHFILSLESEVRNYCNRIDAGVARTSYDVLKASQPYVSLCESLNAWVLLCKESNPRY